MVNEKQLSLAELNKERTTAKVKEALNRMKKGKVPINIKSVSETAKISRKTIYNRLDLKALIEEYQSLQADFNNPKGLESKPKGSSQAERIKSIREKNKELIEEKKKLLEQNLLLTKEITNLQNRLFDLEERLYVQGNLKVLNIRKKTQ